MKIAVLDGFLVNPGDISWEPIAKQGEFTLYEATEPDEAATHIGDAEVVFVNRCNISAAVMDACPNLRFINTFATGFNMIDIAAAKERGIAVCNVPAYSTHAVAQMAAALLLQIACNTAVFDHYVKTHGWLRTDDREMAAIPHMELAGKTIGIIGLGDIGGNMAKIAEALGMNVLAYRRHPDPAQESEHLRFVSLEELYAGSDVISIHCPLNDESRGMIGDAAIAKMRDGVILINTARGAVLDDAAVVRALNSGKIYAVGSDVFAPEPCGKEHPLAMHPRCIATPHVGWAPRETRERVIRYCAENLAAWRAGKPQNRVV